MRIRFVIFYFLITFHCYAAQICADNGLVFDSKAFCETSCSTCTELIGNGTCSSTYQNYVYDGRTSKTYALSKSSGAWSAFSETAIISNVETNSVLQSILNYSGISAAWIGLYDPSKTQNLGSSSDTRFKWRDGSLLNYRNWASGQPDNAVSGGDIGNIAVYGEHWVLMGSDGSWSDTGEHAGQSMSYPALVEFAGQLNCVKGTVPSDETDPEDIITTYCQTNPDKCNLCTDSVDIYQCTAGTSGGYLCPKAQATCDAQYAGSTCPAGGVLNTQTDKCEAARTIACPNGMTYDSNLDRCTMPVICPYSGLLNGSTDLCEAVQSGSSCPTNYTFDTSQNLCVKDPECSSGTYNTTTDRCEFAATYSCPANYTYNSTTATCEATPICPSGTTYNITQNRCLISAILGCVSGYTLSSGSCISSPICLTGSFNSSTDKCEASNAYSCSLGGTYSTSSQCSSDCSQTINATATSTYKWVLTSPGTDSVTGDYNTAIFKTCTVDMKTCWTYASVTRGGGYSPDPTNPAYWGIRYDNDGSIYLCMDLTGTRNYANGFCHVIATYYPDGTQYSCPYGYSVTGYNGELCYRAGTCSQGVCPTGTTLSGSLCVSSPTCSGGGIYNNTTNRCEITTTKNCVSGTSYDSALNMCVSTPTCSDNGVLNTTTDKCSMTVTSSCPNGYTRAGSVCYSSPICSAGIYNAALDRCVLAAVSTCPTDYTLNSTTGKCEKIPTCSAGAYSTTINMCAQLPTISCNSGYTYNSSNLLCESQPGCSSGTYDSTQNQCLAGYSCPYSGQPCVEISGNWLCSKYGCYDAKDQSNYSEDDTTEGENDIIADGEKDDEGNCLGSIYIFNGNDRRCRVPGVQTGFADCCKKKKDWFGLAKCNPTEQLLSSLRSWGKVDGQCREIGEYCSSKFLGICIQKKKSYCCFGSPLARIIQEQGRPQLDISWGSPKTPNCRGFTPEEFQKLDFSKISFDEWINEYVTPELNQNITDNIKNTFENITLPSSN